MQYEKCANLYSLPVSKETSDTLVLDRRTRRRHIPRLLGIGVRRIVAT